MCEVTSLDETITDPALIPTPETFNALILKEEIKREGITQVLLPWMPKDVINEILFFLFPLPPRAEPVFGFHGCRFDAEFRVFLFYFARWILATKDLKLYQIQFLKGESPYIQCDIKTSEDESLVNVLRIYGTHTIQFGPYNVQHSSSLFQLYRLGSYGQKPKFFQIADKDTQGETASGGRLRNSEITLANYSDIMRSKPKEKRN